MMPWIDDESSSCCMLIDLTSLSIVNSQLNKLQTIFLFYGVNWT